MEHIRSTFAKCKAEKRAALISYITAGYPSVDETVDVLLGLENGGAGRLCISFHSRVAGPLKL